MADQDKWEVDSYGEIGPLFDSIVDEKYVEDNRENTVSTGGEGHADVEDQAWKSVPLSNNNIDETKKYQLYADILQIGIKKRSLLLISISKRG